MFFKSFNVFQISTLEYFTHAQIDKEIEILSAFFYSIIQFKVSY